MLRTLKPSTKYFYTVGDGSAWSQELRFRTLAAAGSSKRYPLRIGLVGDLGQTANSSLTRDFMKANHPQVLYLSDHSSSHNPMIVIPKHAYCCMPMHGQVIIFPGDFSYGEHMPLPY